MKAKTTILLTLLFLIINGLVYYVVEKNIEQRIQLVLDEKMTTLQTHYDILLQTQKSTAKALYLETIESARFLEIMSEARFSGKEKRKILRQELKNLFTTKYERAKLKGVLQYHFVFPDNTTFLRMHKPNKFGDDLTPVRDDFRYVNNTQKPIRTFTQGRTAHGFRNVFPLFNKESEYVGSMEVSFSSDSFQWYLNNVSHIHTHFLVDKAIFDANAWKRDDLVLNYSQSAEHPDYMITLGDIHSKQICIVENKVLLEPISDEIDRKIRVGEKFSLYVRHQNHIDVFAFLPINNLKSKSIAWLVSFSESPFINFTLKSGLIIKLMTLFASLLLIYFIARQVRSSELINERHNLLNDILNATDNIMFITNFEKVSFSNDKFKNFFNVKDTNEFNKKIDNHMLSIFNVVEGYLNEDLLRENENPIELFERTIEDERIVSISDRHLDFKSFRISISKTNSTREYLVTLSDITMLQEKHVLTEKKAYFDGLTKVYNRNKFDDILAEEILKSRRESTPLSIAIIDIDKFKDFNDVYGHLIGDEVLIMLAQSVNENVRSADTFARWGGEEFVILFKETSIEIAQKVAEKLRVNIENLEHPLAGKITASFGVTKYIEGDSVESLFKRCDHALYRAKENGRNRVETL